MRIINEGESIEAFERAIAKCKCGYPNPHHHATETVIIEFKT